MKGITEAAAKEIIANHKALMVDFLGLHEWEILFKVENRCEDEAEEENPAVAGEYFCRPDYLQASIYLYHEGCRDKEIAVRALFHELVHLLLADYIRFQSVVTESTSDQASAVFDRVFTSHNERATTKVERLLMPRYLEMFKGLQS